MEEIFYVKARHCRRCGALLTSKQAITDGYGHVCKMRAFDEKHAKQPIDGQISLFSQEVGIHEKSNQNKEDTDNGQH